MEAMIKKSQGMGAIIEDGITTFRIWAPNADIIFFIWDFIEWKKDDIG